MERRGPDGGTHVRPGIECQGTFSRVPRPYNREKPETPLDNGKRRTGPSPLRSTSQIVFSCHLLSGPVLSSKTHDSYSPGSSDRHTLRRPQTLTVSRTSGSEFRSKTGKEWLTDDLPVRRDPEVEGEDLTWYTLV